MTATTIAKRLYRSSDAALRFLPEGPYPLAENRFSWIAIQHGAESDQGSLNVFDLATNSNRSDLLPGRPGFAFPCNDDRHFLIGLERQVGLYDTEEGLWAPMLAAVDSAVENTIINDAVIFDNNLVFGTKDLEFQTKKAGLYLFRGDDRTLVQLRDDQICSNGKAIARGEGVLWLYDIDSPTREIVRYQLDVAAGTLSDRTVVIDLTSDPAVPDGMILTPQHDGVIVSMYHPDAADHGETRWYDIASGRLVHTWQTPGSPQNTCPNLVRHQNRTFVVITTAVEHMPLDRQPSSPEAGSLFFAPTDFDSVGDAPRYPLPSIDDPAI